jgi:hypothetical protein
VAGARLGDVWTEATAAFEPDFVSVFTELLPARIFPELLVLFAAGAAFEAESRGEVPTAFAFGVTFALVLLTGAFGVASGAAVFHGAFSAARAGLQGMRAARWGLATGRPAGESLLQALEAVEVLAVRRRGLSTTEVAAGSTTKALRKFTLEDWSGTNHVPTEGQTLKAFVAGMFT